MDATNCELYAFKSEAKRWSQSDNRPSAPSASASSATCMSTTHSFQKSTYASVHVHVHFGM